MGRGHVEILHEADVPYAALAAEGWPIGAELKRLSHDPETGALTGLLRLPPGYRRPRGHHTTQTELFVIDGSVRVGDAVREWGYYEFSPAETTHEPWTSDGGATVVLFTRGRPDFVPAPDRGAGGRIALDTERIPWSISNVPGPDPGMLSKTLRHSDDTGERVFLCCCVRRYDYAKLEYHDCIEESFCIEGEITMGSSGQMRAGSYFWRPPYLTHGPFYSREGMISLFTVDGPLLNHYVDDPRRTAQENRAEAEAAGPPRDVYAGVEPAHGAASAAL